MGGVTVRAAILATMAIALLAGATASAATGPGAVGGAPTRPLGPPEEGTRTTAARVIGVGRTYDGWLEIDAYGWRPPAGTRGERQQLCTWVEFAADPRPSVGSCLGTGEIREPIALESLAWSRGSKRDTRIGGPLSPQVARVVLTVALPGHDPKQIPATVARVSGSLQRQLDQPGPFGYFFTKLRGHVSARYFRATAYDAHGHKLGAAGALRSG